MKKIRSMKKNKIRVLELGNFIVPAYAGMILAEQGLDVTKWVNGKDPILSCRGGKSLWRWVNEGKTLDTKDAPLVCKEAGNYDIIIDNFRPSTLKKFKVDPVAIAKNFGVVWVSMRSEVGEISFDLIAQARSTAKDFGHIPFWLGDTSGGLWVAFKALTMFLQDKPGHYVLGQSSCLAKLVEGEMVVKRPKPIHGNVVPWDADPYHMNNENALVEYKGETIIEPVRSARWKRSNLWHKNGRFKI